MRTYTPAACCLNPSPELVRLARTAAEGCGNWTAPCIHTQCTGGSTSLQQNKLSRYLLRERRMLSPRAQPWNKTVVHSPIYSAAQHSAAQHFAAAGHPVMEAKSPVDVSPVILGSDRASPPNFQLFLFLCIITYRLRASLAR